MPRRQVLLAVALAAAAAVAASGWVLPAATPARTSEAADACEASGMTAPACRFACREGDSVSVNVEVSWGWGIGRAAGTATCGGETARCTVGATFCASGLARSPEPGQRGAPAEGACSAHKLPLFWFPGSIRVACRAHAPGEASAF